MITHYICNVKGMKMVIYATKTYTLPTLPLLLITIILLIIKIIAI